MSEKLTTKTQRAASTEDVAHAVYGEMKRLRRYGVGLVRMCENGGGMLQEGRFSGSAWNR